MGEPQGAGAAAPPGTEPPVPSPQREVAAAALTRKDVIC
jgi:hypothetical protein